MSNISDWLALNPEAMAPMVTEYMPHRETLTPIQRAFLLLPHREAFYGGAGGGGKSDTLLNGALQWVCHPEYAGLLIRRTRADLAQPGALIDRSHEWLGPTDASWNGDKKRWTFPSGATLSFGYMDGPNDHFQYQGTFFQYIGFDELTQIREYQYRWMFGWNRRKTGCPIPVRMRSASNPGGNGHQWVKDRFVGRDGKGVEGRPFAPAKLSDNPYIDAEEYLLGLEEMDPLTRAQIRDGDWTARREGSIFKREWFQPVDDYPREARVVRFWDLAATAPKPGKDPDWTVGVKVAGLRGKYCILDVRRFRADPGTVERNIANTAIQDGMEVGQRIEEEGGASGKMNTQHFATRVLAGFDFKGVPAQASKIARARVPSSAAQMGNMTYIPGPWWDQFIDELEAFPDGDHDDQVDALSGAVADLTTKRPVARIREVAWR